MSSGTYRRPASLFQYSLGTLLLVMTLIAVCAALVVAAPPLGGWLIVVGSLALVRTLVECRRFLRDGRPLALGAKLGSFLGSLFFSFMALVCALTVVGCFIVGGTALAGIIQWIAEAAVGPQVVALLLPVVGSIMIVAMIAAAGTTFFMVYWQTISPRRTTDRPPAPTAPTGKQRAMTGTDANSTVVPHGCPECGARVKATDAKCWLCGRELVIAAEVVDHFAESPFSATWSPRANAKPVPFQFSLESLLMVITLAAVCLGAFVATPGLGILALIVAAPALLRTAYEGHQSRQRGHALTLSEKLMAFAASAGIALAALAAAAAAFFTACTASILAVCVVGAATNGQALGSRTENTIFFACAIVCGAASLAGFIGIFWLTWPRRR